MFNPDRPVLRLPMLIALLAAVALFAAACGSDDSSDSSDSSGGQSASEASSDDLATWQTDLNAVGCWAGPVDDQMGPETEAAIREYQTAKGLTVDGLLGPQTESALQADVAAGNIVCTTSGSTTTVPGSTTTTASGDATCPGGSACYETSITPTSGGYGTAITVNITEGGCGTEAFLEPPGGGESIAGTGPMDPGAGSLSGMITVPNEIPAPETYTVTTNAGPQDQCAKSFQVTAE